MARRQSGLRRAAAVLALASLAGCGWVRDRLPGGVPMPQAAPQQEDQPEDVRLAGQAALHYLYELHRDREGEGPEGRYYREGGRVYFLNPQEEKVWLLPPRHPLRVPVEEYRQVTGQEYDPVRDGPVLRSAPAGW